MPPDALGSYSVAGKVDVHGWNQGAIVTASPMSLETILLTER